MKARVNLDRRIKSRIKFICIRFLRFAGTICHYNDRLINWLQINSRLNHYRVSPDNDTLNIAPVNSDMCARHFVEKWE